MNEKKLGYVSCLVREPEMASYDKLDADGTTEQHDRLRFNATSVADTVDQKQTKTR